MLIAALVFYSGLVLSPGPVLLQGEDAAYWTIVRKMALAASVAAAREDVRLLQAGKVAEFKALYLVGHKRSYAVVERLDPPISAGFDSPEAFERMEDESEEVVGPWLIADIHSRFVPYAGWLEELTFRPRADWSLGTRLLEWVVLVKAAQYRGRARLP